MGWKANATVQSVTPNEQTSTDTSVTILLTASGADVTSTGDDQVTSVEVKVVSPVATHLTAGTKVTVEADC